MIILDEIKLNTDVRYKHTFGGYGWNFVLLTWSLSAAKASRACPRWPAGGAPNPQPHALTETEKQSRCPSYISFNHSINICLYFMIEHLRTAALISLFSSEDPERLILIVNDKSNLSFVSVFGRRTDSLEKMLERLLIQPILVHNNIYLHVKRSDVKPSKSKTTFHGRIFLSGSYINIYSFGSNLAFTFY